MSGEFQFLIDAAENGTYEERLLARGVMAGILDAVQQAIDLVGAEAAARHRYVVPPEIAKWLAAEQMQIAKGVDLKVALHLKVSKNKTTSFIKTRAAQNEMGKAKASGMTWEDARFMVAERFGVEPETLSRRITRATGQT